MKKILFLLTLCFLCLYILPLDIRPLVIPDEVRYAEVPREMLTSGDWIVPHLNGLLYFEKPVMGYWLNGLGIKLFGENAFAVRFFSAVSAGLSALMVFFLSSRFGYSIRRGVITTAVYLTFLFVYGLGVFNVLDGMFSFFLTACIGFFFMAWSCRGTPRSYYWLLIITGIFCGFAFLTKGFLAFAVPVSIILPFLLWEKDYKMIARMPWIPIFVALIIILPWSVLVHLKAPDYWNFFFWNEHVRRFLSKGAQHKESFFYFFMVLPAALFPWTFLGPASVAGLRAKGIKTPLLRYALCWFVFPFLLFSISSGKLSTYILPCFPGLAILLSTGITEYLNTRKTYWFNKGVILLMVLTVLGILTLIVLQTGMIASVPYVYESPWKSILFIIAMSIFTIVLKMSLTAKDNTKKILLFAAAPLFLYFSVHFLIPDKTILRKCPGALIQRNINRINKNTLVFSPSEPVRAVCWFLKRDDIFMLDKGELDYGLGQKDSGTRLTGYEQFYRLAQKNKGKQRIALVIDQRAYTRIKQRLPVPVFLDSSGNDGFMFIIF
ncbi:MAG: phospholipid carrier-dependent glycosyltransferase [Deltaproteobacteria bacterium]|nr:phospholipid carrier-dependent glycosyltransferase [Deltaproteobacteria bacterium]